MLEVVWTLVPIMILVMIAVPSFRLLYKQVEVPPADLTVKVVGYQWYWGVEYTDEGFGELSFDAVMLEDDERAEKIEKLGVTENEVPRLLAVDNENGRSGEQDCPRSGNRRRRHSCLCRSRLRRQDRRWCRAVSTRLGSRPANPASITGNALNCAVRAMLSCRSRCAS